MNEMVKRSLQYGAEIKVGERTYRGRPPAYQWQTDPKTGITGLVKVIPGLPYVRTN